MSSPDRAVHNSDNATACQSHHGTCVRALEAEAYTERATGTPVRARQLLFEEAAEKAELLERLQQLEE